MTVAGKIYATVEYSTTVDVPASRTAVVAKVIYHPPVGRLTIRTAGLPPGTKALVQLGYSWLQEVEVTDVLTKTDVPVGLLGVYAQMVDVPTGLYQPREVKPEPGFVITPDSSFEMTIRYELLTGLLAINVHGLPPGVDANLSLAPPQEEVRTITRSQIVRLKRGSGGIAALNVQSRKEGFVATEFAKSFFVDTGTTPVPIDFHYTSVGPLNITVAGVRVMQQTFRPTGTVPLVAGKEAIVSAFVHGDTTNGARPTIRARLYRYGQLEHTIVFPSLQIGLPTSVAMDNVMGVVNARIPGPFVQPGLSVVVDVDSDNMFDEPNETDNVFPRTQVPLAVRVGAVHPIAVKFVPIAQAGNFLIGDVTDANAATFLSKTRRMFPLGDISATVRATFGVTVPLTPDNSDGSWLTAASEFAALHAAEGGGYYYYGVVRTAYTSGIAGIGLIPGRVALGWDFHPTATSIMAHELGHNFGLLHTRCGTTDGLDLDFPHGGSIGHGGFDLMMNREYGRDTPDFMGYCDNSWISDYGFEKIFNGVVVGSPPARQAAPRGPEPGVLIWGRVQNGRPVLEPAFDVHTLPSLPTRPGRHTLEVVGEDGTALLRVAFSGEGVDHGRSSDEVFAFVIPLSALRGQRPARLRLTSSGRSVVVERAAAVLAAPLATRGTGAATRVSSDNAATRGMLIRDARTREILAISRGEAATIATQAPELEVTWSDGVRSTTRRIVVR